MVSVDTEKLKQVDIVNDPDFKEADCTFENICRELKANGKGKIQHYSEIEPEDIKKFYQNADVNTPKGLLYKTRFDVMFRLGRRGRDNSDMTMETFTAGTDAHGRRLIYQATDDLDKNHDENDRTFETIGEASMRGSWYPKVPCSELFDVSQCIKPKTEGYLARTKSISKRK